MEVILLLDLLIQNGIIVDGTGREPYKGNIGILNGKIEVIIAEEDSSSSIEAANFLDARGHVVCPGFIDMHSHSDLQIFLDSPSDAKVRQGITTELLGQDGLGPAPVNKDSLNTIKGLLAGLDGMLPDEKWTWQTFSDYLNAIESSELFSNVAVLLCQGPIRIEAMGMEERQPTSQELEKMKSLICEGMEAGAFGLSSGLIYPPCAYADTNELIELNKKVAYFKGVYVVHQRDEGYHLLRSFDEVTKIAQQSGVALEISHLQAYGRINWPLMDEVLAKADQLIKMGLPISWDRYPYIAGCTVLTAVLPTWTFSEGTEALIRNLKRKDFRTKIHEDFTKGLEVWHNRQISVGWENIIVTAVQLPGNKWMEGKSCQEIADILEKDPIDMVMDLLAEERLGVTMISFYGSEDILDKVITHPQGTVGTDGIFGGKPHPRLYGTYPRYFRTFVRDKKRLTLSDAVRKVTSYPASILGINNRGIIREGYWADLVVFDPETISDRASYENPVVYPVGIDAVLVNGIMAVDENGCTGNRPGMLLRHKK